MVRVGLVGLGYWGPNLLRNLQESEHAELTVVCDRRADRLAEIKRSRPTLAAADDPMQVLRGPDTDAVVIATPLETHFDLTLEALRNGKHVLVEKPFCSTSEQAETLVEEAARRRLTLMVDHTFVYSGAVRKMKSIVDSGDLGELYYYNSMRFNLGLYRSDVNVVWDLAPHDFSIVDYLSDEVPVEISAVGVGHVEAGLEDTSYVTVFFQSSFLAHMGLSWLSPTKVRSTLLGGDKKMIVYDDLETTEKVKVYDKGVSVDSSSSPDAIRDLLVSYRTGDMFAPLVDRREPLSCVVEEFLDSIENSRRPLSDGESGIRVVRLLEAAGESILQRGRPVRVRR